MEVQSSQVTPKTFPTPSNTATGVVNDVTTTVTRITFSDKILITVTQNGRLGHWIHVPLSNPSPDPTKTFSCSSDISAPSTLLPLPHLTATTILGGTIPERNTIGQLYATQIASVIAMKYPGEQRTVVVGLGLERAGIEIDKKVFVEVVGLVLEVL